MLLRNGVATNALTCKVVPDPLLHGEPGAQLRRGRGGRKVRQHAGDQDRAEGSQARGSRRPGDRRDQVKEQGSERN